MQLHIVTCTCRVLVPEKNIILGALYLGHWFLATVREEKFQKKSWLHVTFDLIFLFDCMQEDVVFNIVIVISQGLRLQTRNL